MDFRAPLHVSFKAEESHTWNSGTYLYKHEDREDVEIIVRKNGTSMVADPHQLLEGNKSHPASCKGGKCSKREQHMTCLLAYNICELDRMCIYNSLVCKPRFTSGTSRWDLHTCWKPADIHVEQAVTNGSVS